MPAITELESTDLRKPIDWWSDEKFMIDGPLYKVNTKAPAIDIMLPITFALLLLLFADNFSILNCNDKRKQNKGTIEWDDS